MLYDDYLRFHQMAVESGDIDPVYPVLRELAAYEGWSPEHTVRAVFTYVAYYDLGSALRVLSAPGLPDFLTMDLGLPCATERRAHRQHHRLRKHLEHLDAIARQHDGLRPWLLDAMAGSPEQAWASVTARCLMRVEGNGRWSSYKTAEMLSEVCGFDLAAPDMNHANSSGPRQGLALLYPEAARLNGRNDPATIAVLNRISDRHVDRMRSDGVAAKMEQAETTLCDFHSLACGRYYVGHDIDQMQAQLERTPSPLADLAWSARRSAFAKPYLGELNGRKGTDRERCRVYRDTGAVLGRAA